jgi:Zn-dependent protease
MDEALFAGIIQFMVLLLSLSVHESAHAWSADRLGDPTARLLGRVSLNPMVHAELFGTIIFPIIGLISGLMFGWAKPVPVNVSRLRNPARDHMLVAAAGPVSNVLLAALFFVALMLMKVTSVEAAGLVDTVARFRIPQPQTEGILTPLAVFAFYGIVLNIVLAVFNLIPVAPLDGATVLSGLLPRSLSDVFDQFQNYGFVILILLLYTGVPEYLYAPPLRLVRSFLLAF